MSEESWHWICFFILLSGSQDVLDMLELIYFSCQHSVHDGRCHGEVGSTWNGK